MLGVLRLANANHGHSVADVAVVLVCHGCPPSTLTRVGDWSGYPRLAIHQTGSHDMTDFANLPVAEPASLGIDANRLARVDARMAQAVENGEVPGVTTVLIRHGHVAHVSSHGYLDAERKNPLPIDALFRMYSQTKPVTAALTMQLQEEGVFYVDEPITKWLPEFANRQVLAPFD
ncbi:MAG: beta-lactamase family protein, partial [Chloroflexi bacterium]|nr:beta-lactamase family protein [Chloroflexota bacterium]